MGWLVKLLGGNVLGVVDKLVGRFAGDRTAREAGYHDESMESRREFAAEFQVSNRTWFDSLIDGINRLPRPVIVAMVIWYFVLAVRDPVEFQIVNTALDGVPEFMWQIAMLVIGFYFVAREFQKSRDGKLSMSAKDFNEQQRRIAELKAQQPKMDGLSAEALAKAEGQYEAAMGDPKPLPNAAIEEWNRRRKAE